MLTHCVASQELIPHGRVCVCLDVVYEPALLLTSIHTVEDITANCCSEDSGGCVAGLNGRRRRRTEGVYMQTSSGPG